MLERSSTSFEEVNDVEIIGHWMTANWQLVYLGLGVVSTVWLIGDRWFLSLFLLALPPWQVGCLAIVTVLLWPVALTVTWWYTFFDVYALSAVAEGKPLTNQDRRIGRERFFERPPEPPRSPPAA